MTIKKKSVVRWTNENFWGWMYGDKSLKNLYTDYYGWQLRLYLLNSRCKLSIILICSNYGFIVYQCKLLWIARLLNISLNHQPWAYLLHLVAFLYAEIFVPVRIKARTYSRFFFTVESVFAFCLQYFKPTNDVTIVDSKPRCTTKIFPNCAVHDLVYYFRLIYAL